MSKFYEVGGMAAVVRERLPVQNLWARRSRERENSWWRFRSTGRNGGGRLRALSVSDHDIRFTPVQNPDVVIVVDPTT
ncbi:MAG: hypothetical protein R2861_06390 [Desulfobacterales bacterium]